ncbi:hypothetical protein PspLS_09090 [Pyricularia sp. CBS 133598]|nr:hypothetical protein PspLS_09090 [Pyricularia sp. CBS 133598]
MADRPSVCGSRSQGEAHGQYPGEKGQDGTTPAEGSEIKRIMGQGVVATRPCGVQDLDPCTFPVGWQRPDEGGSGR